MAGGCISAMAKGESIPQLKAEATGQPVPCDGQHSVGLLLSIISLTSSPPAT